GLELGGAHVVARRRHDDVLLPVDDREVALGVEAADVAGVEPAAGVEHLGRPLRVVEVAAEDTWAPDEDLVVRSEADLDAGNGPAGRAWHDPVRRPGPQPRRLRH